MSIRTTFSMEEPRATLTFDTFRHRAADQWVPNGVGGMMPGTPEPGKVVQRVDDDGHATFAVDTGRRTITGLAVPWGQHAKANGRAFRFAPGVLKYAALNRVKLLRDHDHAQAVGRAIDLVETERGLEATFRVAPGRAGDEVLALAADEVLDGLSIGVDFREEDLVPDPMHPSAYLVTKAALREISLVAIPAFDDSRLTSVRASDAASREETAVNKCQHCGAELKPGVAHTCAGAAAVSAGFTAEDIMEFAAARARKSTPAAASGSTGDSNDGSGQAGNTTDGVDKSGNKPDPNQRVTDEDRLVRPGDPTSSAYVDDKHPEGRTGTATTWDGRGRDSKPDGESVPPQDAQFSAAQATALVNEMMKRQVVDPTGRRNTAAQVRESLPYTFARKGQNGEVRFSSASKYNFHSDLLEMARRGDDGSERAGQFSDAGKRVMALIKAQFDVDTADVNELYPNIQRPDMFVDQRDYRRPIFDLIGRGDVPGGGVPFTFPKFASASGLVGNHTEGTEPASGTYVTTDQTITPGAISGKASLTREVWTRPGNPATASLVWNQMVRGYWEAAESAAATFLNTLTSAADIALGAGTTDAQVVAAWEAALADLQFVRGYDFTAFIIEANLYKKFAAATASDGRKYYPILNPQNATGQARTRFQTLDLAGVEGIPSWALTATAGSPNSSWLFDPQTVWGWLSSPERLEFPGTAPAGGGAYAPVAMVDLAIWGWRAFANTDIGGVRQVIYDTTA